MSSTPRGPLTVQTFMTHTMKDADIAALATARDGEMRDIMDAVERSRRASPGSLQHVVIYGARGFGKSFMTRRVQVATRDLSDEYGPVRFVLLPEEQHNLQRSPHVLLETLAARLEGMVAGTDAGYEGALFRWPKPEEEEQRWREAEARLERAIDAALDGSRGLVIAAIENFDQLLATLFEKDIDEQRLRGWLDRPGNRMMLLATATGTVDLDYGKPLFHAFESVRLAPWTPDDCLAYFAKRREYEGLPPLSARQEAKARAVAEFIGGTPRLAQLLAEVIETEDALTVAETMSALADRLAEYYRRRIEDLRPLAQGLLDALIRGGEPVSATALAERVGADGQNRIAQVMSELQAADIIRGRPAPGGKETLYSVTDRVFVHYYRLRQGSEAVKETPLATILDFLEKFYTKEEQRAQVLKHLEAGRRAEADLFGDIAQRGVVGHFIYEETALHRWKAFSEFLSIDDRTYDALLTKMRTKTAADIYVSSKDRPESDRKEKLINGILRTYALHKLANTASAEAEILKLEEDFLNDDHYRIVIVTEYQFLLFHRFEKQSARSILKILSVFNAADAEASAWSFFHASQEAMKEVSDLGDEDLLRVFILIQQTVILALTELSLIKDQDLVISHLTRFVEEMEAIAIVNNARHNYVLATDVELARTSALLKLQDYDRAIDSALQAINFAAKSNSPGRRVKVMITYAEAASEGKEIITKISSMLKSAIKVASKAHDFSALPRLTMYASAFGRWEPVECFVELFSQFLISIERRIVPDLGLQIILPSAFVAAARAEKQDEFIEELDRHHSVVTSQINSSLRFELSHGRDLAAIASSEGRAAAYQAISGLLPRIAAFLARLPEDKRDSNWLPNLMQGFAKACRDPGLLRDVADFLTPDLAPQAANTALLLRALADVDAAEDAERVLARMDPDVATLVRRMRDIPDPPPPKPKRAGRPKRR